MTVTEQPKHGKRVPKFAPMPCLYCGKPGYQYLSNKGGHRYMFTIHSNEDPIAIIKGKPKYRACYKKGRLYDTLEELLSSEPRYFKAIKPKPKIIEKGWQEITGGFRKETKGEKQSKKRGRKVNIVKFCPRCGDTGKLLHYEEMNSVVMHGSSKKDRCYLNRKLFAKLSKLENNAIVKCPRCKQEGGRLQFKSVIRNRVMHTGRKVCHMFPTEYLALVVGKNKESKADGHKQETKNVFICPSCGDEGSLQNYKRLGVPMQVVNHPYKKLDGKWGKYGNERYQRCWLGKVTK